MKKTFFLLSITLILDIYQATAQADNTNQPSTIGQKPTGKELSSASSLTLMPFDANSLRYNPNAIKVKQNFVRANLLPNNLKVIDNLELLPQKQSQLGQMPCYRPKGNYFMPIHIPSSTIDYKLWVIKSQ
jgi:hypothetical protein